MSKVQPHCPDCRKAGLTTPKAPGYAYCQPCHNQRARRHWRKAKGLDGDGIPMWKPPKLRPGLRQCPHCLRALAFSQFYTCPSGRDGRSTYCKLCELALRKTYRGNNRTHFRAVGRRWRKKNSEMVNVRQRAARLRKVLQKHATDHQG
jgi:hypothetical protein